MSGRTPQGQPSPTVWFSLLVLCARHYGISRGDSTRGLEEPEQLPCLRASHGAFAPSPPLHQICGVSLPSAEALLAGRPGNQDSAATLPSTVVHAQWPAFPRFLGPEKSILSCRVGEDWRPQNALGWVR